MPFNYLLQKIMEHNFAVYCKAKFYQCMEYIETYVFDDWQFLNFLTVLILLNSMLGLYNHCKTRKIQMCLLSLWLKKLLIYTCFLVLVHILSNFTVAGEKNQFFGWFSAVGYSALILRESIFMLENMGAIRPGLIPGWIIKKLKKYDREGLLPSRQSGEKQKKLPVRQ